MGVLQQRGKRICPRTSKVCDPHHIEADLPFEGTSLSANHHGPFRNGPASARTVQPITTIRMDVVAERGFRTGHGEITDKRAICHTHYGGWKVRITPDALLRFEHFAEEARLAGLVGSDAKNLEDAIRGESYEVDTMYREFAEQAQAAADKDAAARFEEVRRDEMKHRDAFKTALAKVEKVTAKE